MAARVHKIAQQLSQDKKIDSAHANYLHQPSSKIPSNDPKIIQEWYLGGKFKQCDSAGLCKTIIGANVLKSWEITKGNPADVLAIIDSGFIWPNELDLPSGVLSCPSRQYDFAGNLYSKDPQDNHGFLVGSLLGACSNNEYGAASPNWYSKLLMYGHDRNELDAFTIFRSYKKLLEFDPPPQILNTSFWDTYYALETKKEVATQNKDLENFFLTYLDYASKFNRKI